MGFDRCNPCAALARIPIDSDGFDRAGHIDQALVAQIAQHQPFGVGAQGHQGHQLALVHIHREGAFGRNGQVFGLAVLVDRLHGAGQWGKGLGQAGQHMLHRGHSLTDLDRAMRPKGH